MRSISGCQNSFEDRLLAYSNGRARRANFFLFGFCRSNRSYSLFASGAKNRQSKRVQRKYIEVRGWLISYNGPMIAHTRSDKIEVLGT